MEQTGCGLILFGQKTPKSLIQQGLEGSTTLGKDEVTSSNLVSSSILKSLVSLVNPLKQGFFVILYGFEHCCTKFLQLSHNVSHRRFLHFVNGTKCGTEQGG